MEAMVRGWLPAVRAKAARTTAMPTGRREGAVYVEFGGFAAERVADEEAYAEHDQQPRARWRRESGHLGEGEGDVVEGAEHAAVAKDS